MDSLLVLLGLAVVVFASTNLDDLFILLGFFADPKFRARHVVIGQYAGIAVLYGISVVASVLAWTIPKEHVGLLGLVPIVIGAKKLWELTRVPHNNEQALQRSFAPRATAQFLSVAAVTAANGGDNIGIYTPVFAVRSGVEIVTIGVVFAVMTAVWCLLAWWMVRHSLLGRELKRYGHRAIPFVLIGLGLLILYEAGSFG